MKKLIRSLILAAAPLLATAAPVTSDEAAQAVGTWIGLKPQLGCRMGEAVAGARTCSPTNGVTFHVVKMAGGGFVVTSSDTEIEPILAFSASDDLVESEKNPLWTMLRRDLAARGARRRQAQFAAAGSSAAVAQSAAEAKWARLLPVKSTNALVRVTHAATGKETLSDIRVAPLLQTKWSQQQDAYYSNMGDPCYNYYTPDHDPCGCVATAGAQIMRYHRHPTASVTPGTYACRVMTGKDWISQYSYYPVYEDRDLTMQGGVYDWDAMPLVPADGTTLAQRKAIGKLTSDVGISCLMAYGEDGSSAGGYMLARSLPERFGYASAIAACGNGLASSLVRKVLISNLDAKLPVMLGLDGPSGGHAVVADGYGYSMSTFYAHVNLGWAGKDDAWYAPPYVDDYNAVDSMVYNIYPTGVAGGVICSGRVLSPSGAPVAGATVSASGAASAATTTDANGIYAFILSPGSYTVSSGSSSQNVTLSANVGTTVTVDGYYHSTPAAVVNNVVGVDLTVAAVGPPPTPLSDAFGTSFALATGGEAGWFATTASMVEGTSSAQSGKVGDNQTSWMETTVTGPCMVSFQWMVSSEQNYDCLRVYVDGVEQDSISGDRPWTQKSVFVMTEGESVVRWAYSKDGSASSGEDCGRVDALSVTPVDPADIFFEAGGDAPWFQQASVTYDGTPAWQVGNLAALGEGGSDYVTSSLKMIVQGPCTLSLQFGFQGDSSSFSCWLDDEYVNLDHNWGSGSPSWKLNEVAVAGAGEHELTIQCYGWSGSDCANSKYWIADVTRTPAPAGVTVSFDANGGYCTTSSRYYSTGFSYGSLPTPVRSQGEFMGWYTAAIGGERVTDEDYVKFDVMRLYARWGLPIEEALGVGSDVEVIVDANWKTGEPEWYGNIDLSCDGDGCACAGDGNDGKDFSVTVEGPGTLSFVMRCRNASSQVSLRVPWDEWSYSSENICYLCSSDGYSGVQTYTVDGCAVRKGWTDGWMRFEIELYGTGSQTLEFLACEQSSYGNQTDWYALVDDMSWTPATGSAVVRFEYADGKFLQDKTYQPGDTYGTLPTPTRTGYVFAGWCTDEDLLNAVDATDYVPFDGAHLYAKWKKTLAYKNANWYESEMTYTTGEKVYRTDVVPEGGDEWGYGSSYYSYVDFEMTGAGFFSFGLNLAGSAQYTISVDGKQVDSKVVFGYMYGESALTLSNWQRQNLTISGSGKHTVRLTVTGTGYTSDTGVALVKDEAFEQYGKAETFGGWSDKVKNYGCWMTGNLPALQAKYAKDTTPKGRVLHALATLLTAAEDKSVQALFNGFGCAINYMDLNGSWGNVDFAKAPTGNKIVDTLATVGEPLVKTALADLEAISGNMAEFDLSVDDCAFFDEGVTIDYGDILYLRAALKAILGFASWSKAYNVEIDYDQFVEDASGVALKTVSNEKSLMTESAWEKIDWLAPCDADRDGRSPVKAVKAGTSVYVYAPHDDGLKIALLTLVCENRAAEKSFDGTYYSYEGMEEYSNMSLVSEFGDATVLRLDVSKLSGVKIANVKLKRISASLMTADEYPAGSVYWGASNTDAERFILHQTKVADKIRNAAALRSAKDFVKEALLLAQQADAKVMARTCECLHLVEYYGNDDDVAQRAQSIAALRRNLPKAIQSLDDGSVQEYDWVDVFAQRDKYANTLADPLAVDVNKLFSGEITRGVLPASVSDDYYVSAVYEMDPTLNGLLPETTRSEWCAFLDAKGVERSGLSRFAFDYYENGDGTITLTGLVGAEPTGELDVPAEYAGYEVAGIAEEAFRDCAGLTSVSLPATVTFVGEKAFAGCSGLISVTFPASLLEVGKEPFLSCSQLKSVSFMGAEPSVGEGFYYLNEKSSAKLVPATTYVQPDQGWSDVPGTWQGRPITYADPVGAQEVKFDANGGKCATASLKYVEGEDYYALPTPTRSGYVFDGWYTAKDGGEPVYEGDYVDFSIYPTSTPTLYARWLKAYTLTLKGTDVSAEYAGVTYAKTASVLNGGDVWLSAPESYEAKNVTYLFQGWTPSKSYDFGSEFSAASCETAMTMPAADVTMTATYVKESEAAWLTMYATAEAVVTDDSTIEPDYSKFLWSVDGKNWFRSGVTALVKKGSCTVQWKSANAAWAAPTAKTKVTLKAGDEYSNEESPAEFTFVLAARLTAVVYADGETSESTAGGTATMNPANGQIPKGKALTLTAKAASGYVFVGWQYEKDAAEEGLCPFSSAATYKLESFGCCGAEYRYVDPDDGAIHLQAVFRPISDYSEDDVRCLFRSVSVGGFSREVSYEASEFRGEVEVKVGLGCACDIVLDCSPTGLPITYALTGTLPKGLKFDAATGRISGTPTATGTFPLAVKAADPKGHVCSLVVSLVVKSVYAPVVGDWRALLSDESGVPAGLFEMSVTEAGKVSGKVTTATGTTSITPTITWEPDEEDPDGDGTIYVGYSKATGNEKTGSEVWLEFDAESGFVSYGSMAWKNGEMTSSVDLSGTALRSDATMLKDSEFQETFLGKYHTLALNAEGGDAEGYRTPEELMASGYLTVTTDKKGAVKVAGKLADGEKVSASTVLLPSEDGASASAILFVVPSGYKKKGSVALWLEFDSQGGVTSSVGAWVTPPLLDAISGWESDDEIFLPGLLSLSANGSVYSKLDDLTGYYLSLSVSTGEESPTLEYSYADAEKTKCYAQAEPALSDYSLGSEMLTGGKGGKITVGKSPSPWKDADGYWHYDETKEDKRGETQPITNPGGVTISFKPATGIFSGKFNLFFDYEIPQYDKYGEEKDPKQDHKSVSCSYEGVLVNGSGVAAAQYSGKFTYEYWTVDKLGNEKSATKTYTKKYALPVSWSVE